jgi:hypothetical protein
VLKFDKYHPHERVPTSTVVTSATDLLTTPSSSSPVSPVLAGLLEPKQLAAELGLSARTLSRWHVLRQGPARIRVGRKIFYEIIVVREWLTAHREPVVRPPVSRPSRDKLRRRRFQ